MKRRSREYGEVENLPNFKRRKLGHLVYVTKNAQVNLEKELIIGSRYGHVNKVTQLISVGVNPNCMVEGCTPLYSCLIGGNINILKKLLSSGAILVLQEEWV